MRPSILLVSYYFPPLGLGGVSRALGLFKQLPKTGWECEVLTVKPVLYRAYEPELLAGLDRNRIYRSGSRDPQRLLYLLGMRTIKPSLISGTRPVGSRYFPDSKVGWVKPAVRLGRTLMENRRYQAVISTSPPISAHLIGRQLASEMAIPWIADFRDYWTAHKIDASYAGERQKKRANSLLASIQTQSTTSTAVNQTVADYVGATNVITNSYDHNLAALWTSPPKNQTVAIGLLGHQHDPKMVAPLFQLLSMMRHKDIDSFTRLRIVQVGQVAREDFLNLLDEHNLTSMTNLHGRLSRTETVQTLNAASLFYIGVADPAYLPGRTFDMLASGRPMLVYAPPGSEYDRLIKRTGNGCCFHDGSYERGLEYLLRLTAVNSDHTLPILPRPEYAEPFSSQRMAQEFAQVLEGIV